MSETRVNLAHDIYSTYLYTGSHTYAHWLPFVMFEMKWTEEEARRLFPKANFAETQDQVDCVACLEAIHA